MLAHLNKTFCFFFQGGEVTVGIRDGTAHVLRCLKVWYDMPSEVLFVAVNLVDRFLTKMKVRNTNTVIFEMTTKQKIVKFVLTTVGLYLEISFVITII